jgi:ABC-type transport system substrate-binding protein
MRTHRLFSLLTVFAILASTILVGCGTQPPAAAPKAAGGTLIYGTMYEPSALNPIVAPDVVTKWILETIFDGLVAINDKMGSPQLADSWTFRLTGSLYLQAAQGRQVHDGKPDGRHVKFT